MDQSEPAGPTMIDFFRAIAAGEELPAVERRLAARPEFAVSPIAQGATRSDPTGFFLPECGQYVYAGATALHIAAGAHRPELVRLLLAWPADVDATDRRRARPLHLAADGRPGVERWRPDRQVEVITELVGAGADVDAGDANGATPLHRAVRSRCADAVEALLALGADPRRRNRSGSTPVDLATRTTGRSGSGSPAARAAQARILQLLRS